jgi:NAD(P)H dehydrogenase (quinone)
LRHPKKSLVARYSQNEINSSEDRAMYLVTGASGQLGQAVINHLLTTYNVPANEIIAASCGLDKLAGPKAKGVELRSADFNDEAGLAKVFAGVKRVLLISTNELEPGARIKQHLNAIRAAEKAGIEHVLYTSMPKPDTSAVSFAPDHLRHREGTGCIEAQGLDGPAP